MTASTQHRLCIFLVHHGDSLIFKIIKDVINAISVIQSDASIFMRFAPERPDSRT